jgi:hypothetical protein
MENDPLVLRVPLRGTHHPWPDGAHLGTPVFAENRRHDVAAESGSGHEQEPGFLFDGQTRAIRGEPGSQLGCDDPRQIPAEMSRPDEQNFRVDVCTEVRQALPVSCGQIMRKGRVVDDMDFVTTVADSLSGNGIHPVSEEKPHDFCSERAGQFPGFARQFP